MLVVADVTRVAVAEPAVEPLPQQRTLPLSRIAQVCCAGRGVAIAVRPAPSFTGRTEPGVSLSPIVLVLP